MTSPTGNVRKLPYPLSNPQNIGSSATDSSPSLLSLDGWETENNNERVNVVLSLSLNEYIALATCIDIGRDIAYGENSDYIWWLWSRAIVSIDICQSIIDCINNPESGVATAITDITLNQSASEYRDYGQSENDSNLALATNPTCDPDIVWSQCYQLIEYFHEVNLEIFTQLEVATNNYELLANVVGDITGLDESSIDAVLGWGEYILENIVENYEVQATIAYRETLACELFCIALENDCEITPRMGYDILKNRLSSAITLESLIDDALLYIVTGSWSGSEIADVMFFSQFSFRSMLGLLLRKIGYNDTQLRLAVAVNDANDDWILICDECPEFWTETLDLTVSDYGAVFDVVGGVPAGSWSDGVGFITSDVDSGSEATRIIACEIPFATSTVNSWSIEGMYNEGLTNDVNNTAIGLNYRLGGSGSSEAVIALTFAEISGDPLPLGKSGYEISADGFRVFLKSSRGGFSGSVVITSITLSGVGVNPFT